MVEPLAAASVDDLVEFLDVSMDEAESIRAAAKIIVDARNLEIGAEGVCRRNRRSRSGQAETVETEARKRQSNPAAITKARKRRSNPTRRVESPDAGPRLRPQRKLHRTRPGGGR